MTVERLLSYYEEELHFLRRMLGDFAKDYPDKAGKLLLDEDDCGDPHVERMIESVAVLTARTRLKLDESYPAISDSLLGILHPQLVAPVPPMTVTQLELSPTSVDATEPCIVPRDTYFDAPPTREIQCRFRSAYDLELWPLQVEDVSVVPISQQQLQRHGRVKAVAAIRVRVKTAGGQPFADLAGFDRIRFYLHGRDVAPKLLEALLSDPRGVVVRWGNDQGEELLPADRLRHVGFRREEALLQYPRGSFEGYRFLQELYAFPQKFMFVEIGDLAKAARNAQTDTVELLVLVNRPLMHLEGKIGPDNFKLGCVPAINLFEANADTKIQKRNTVQHLVEPDYLNAHAFEVHSIEEVQTISQDGVRDYAPFFALRYSDPEADQVAFWHSERVESLRSDDHGTDVYLTLVDPLGQPTSPDVRDTLHVKILCLNRDLAARLPYKNPDGDLRVEGKPEVGKITCLERPTTTRRPALRRRAQPGKSQWQVVSSLSLNHLSLSGSPQNPKAGLEAFLEILGAHDFIDDPVTRQRRSGLVDLRTRTVTRRLPGRGIARGLEVTLEFDEAKFVGSGVFLFAAVYERFLAAYASVNSFTQTTATVRRLKDNERESEWDVAEPHDEDDRSEQVSVLKRWAPRIGEQAQM